MWNYVKLSLWKTHSCFKHPTQAHHDLLGPKTRERLAWQSEPGFGIAMHQSSQQISLTSISLSFYLAIVQDLGLFFLSFGVFAKRWGQRCPSDPKIVTPTSGTRLPNMHSTINGTGDSRAWPWGVLSAKWSYHVVFACARHMFKTLEQRNMELTTVYVAEFIALFPMLLFWKEG